MTEEAFMQALARVRTALKAEAAVYQGRLKREVAQASGIPYAKLARMPFAQWCEIRDRWEAAISLPSSRKQPRKATRHR